MMSPQLETVLEISAFGTTILFGALLGLIGLMYLLTSQRLSSVAAKQPDESASEAPGVAALEQKRQLRAIALAVAVAPAPPPLAHSPAQAAPAWVHSAPDPRQKNTLPFPFSLGARSAGSGKVHFCVGCLCRMVGSRGMSISLL